MESNKPPTFSNKVKNYKKEQKRDIYSRCLITKNIGLPITAIDKNIKETIENQISFQFEGKCVNEGYVKLGSSKIITYSSGIIERGTNILFEVLFECMVCFPVEGMFLSCIAKNITKAGIRAESADESPSPIVVFIARDHNYSNTYFSSIQEGDKFQARIIGQRFELNDKYISIIADVVKPRNDTGFSNTYVTEEKEKEKEKGKEKEKEKGKKPKLIIEY
jgi:DNA-directed RNA polymerase subunit E'/Rpb7